jgi:hypothetical protein
MGRLVQKFTESKRKFTKMVIGHGGPVMMGVQCATIPGIHTFAAPVSTDKMVSLSRVRRARHVRYVGADGRFPRCTTKGRDYDTCKDSPKP